MPKRAEKILERVRERARGDDPFGRQVRRLSRSEKPYSDEMLAEALRIHEDLAPARKAANRAGLGLD